MEKAGEKSWSHVVLQANVEAACWKGHCFSYVVVQVLNLGVGSVIVRLICITKTNGSLPNSRYMSSRRQHITSWNSDLNPR